MPTWWLLWLLSGIAIGALAAMAFPWQLRRSTDDPRMADVEHLTAELQARQQRAIEALRLNHARWQTLAEALSVGVVLLGKDRRILLTNTAARRMLAMLGEPAGVGRLERLGPRSLDDIFAKHRDPAPVEIQVDEGRAATGRPRIFEVSAKPVVAGAGGEWVLTLADVTDERETARRLWLRERLAAVGQLAAGIAHDFNNLLQSITLAAEMSHQSALGDGSRAGDPEGTGEPSSTSAEDPELVENLDIILQQSRHAAELVRQILDFARQSPTQSRALELGPFIEETVGLLQRTLPDSVAWQLELDGDYRVHGDPAQLQQLLTNLAVNAEAAMPDGGTLRIALAETTFQDGTRKPSDGMHAGPWVTLTVSDTGCGMSSALLKRIFEPFFTTKGRAQGTGLGLSQVYGIVQQQGGFIDVDSTVGEGTTFTIYLPPATRDGDADSAEAPAEIPEGRGELVLVVDDDEAILRGAKMALLSFGYRVLTAPDTAAALGLVERHADGLRLMLADVALPGIRRSELVPRLHERNPDAAVLFTSGYVPRAADGEPRVPADADVLEKPFSLDELATAISRALHRQRQERDSLAG